MKRFFSLSLLLTAAAAFASADAITVACPTLTGFGNSGTMVTTCNAAAGPVGATSLDKLILTFEFDADFGLGNGSVVENFNLLGAGITQFGTSLNHGDQPVTKAVRGIEDEIVILNPSAAQVTTALSGLQIQDNWHNGTGSLHDTLFSYAIEVDYTTAPSTPEPATLGLMGSALVGLGVVARRRRS